MFINSWTGRALHRGTYGPYLGGSLVCIVCASVCGCVCVCQQCVCVFGSVLMFVFVRSLFEAWGRVLSGVQFFLLLRQGEEGTEDVRRLRHTETAGPWRTDQACGPRPPVPNVAFWTDKKTSSLSCLSSSLTLLSEPTRKKLALCAVCLPAPKAHKRRLRHTETAGPWRTDQACGPRSPVPNVAFWTDKKTSSLSCLSSSREGSQTAPSPHRNSRALKDGPGLRATAPSA